MKHLIETAGPTFDNQVPALNVRAITSSLGQQNDTAEPTSLNVEEEPHPTDTVRGQVSSYLPRVEQAVKDREQDRESVSNDQTSGLVPQDLLAPVLRSTPERQSGELLMPLYGFESARQPKHIVEAPATTKEGATQAIKSDRSAVSSVLRTAGLVSGVGPVVTGLIKLFGGGGSQSELLPLPQFSLPESINLDAGLTAEGSIIPVERGASDIARPVSSRAASPAATQIHVNVTAMDSRSFLDHSDDIARAVRDAMLRSHALNEFITEL